MEQISLFLDVSKEDGAVEGIPPEGARDVEAADEMSAETGSDEKVFEKGRSEET